MSNTIVLEHVIAGPETGRTDVLPARRRRVYIFPTRYGLFFGLLLIAMLLGAVNYNNSMAYLLTFLLGGLFLVCLLHTYKNLRGLIITSQWAPPVFAGNEARFPLLIDNRTGPGRIALTFMASPPLKEKGPGKPGGQEYMDWEYMDMDANQLGQCVIALRANKRGPLPLPRIKVRSVYPLGLFQAWSYLNFERTCLVYPRPRGRRRLPAMTASDTGGKTGDKAGSEDFAGFRDYRSGDSVGNIDWKALAREQGPLVKLFQGHGAGRLALHWDMTSHLSDTEARLSQLCLWVLEADKHQVPYQLALPEARVDFGLGETHQRLCLEKLAAYGLPGANRLEANGFGD